jgi:TP901 family phage tail tape measure protein
MTDKIDAQVSIDAAAAIKALNRVIDQLTALSNKTPAVAKALDVAQKQLVNLSAALGNTTKKAESNLAVIKAQSTAYRTYADSVRVAAQAQKDLRASQKNAEASYAPNIAATRLRQTTTQSGHATDDSALIKSQKAQRASELAALKSDIVARNNAEQQAARIRERDAQTSNARVQRINQQARTQELAQLRASMVERNSILQASSKAQVAYAKAAGGARNYGKDINIQGLANQRYALYDVATTWGLVATATLGASAAVVKVGIDYQKNFAQVQRTVAGTTDQLDALRSSLIDLSTSMPVSFQDLTNIAALGGQLGVGVRDIESFTQVVAELAATTNLTAEAAGTALGRFKALFSQQDVNFSALGSAILKVGVNSVATESQIVNTSTQIASMGHYAGLTAEQVVGLSGALASVGTQPELARGTITRTFTNMSVAVQAGGDKLAEFARVSGLTADQFKATWNTPEFANTFQKFLSGLGKEGQNAIGTLKDLGITSTRDVPTLLKLAGATDVVRKSFENSASGYKDNTELARQYAITAGTVASKLATLGNTLKAILESSGSATLGPIAGFLDVVEGLAKSLAALGNTDVGKVLGVIVVSLTGLLGAFIALRAAQALTTASAYAFITAEAALNAEAEKTGLSLGTLTGKMVALTVGTTRAAAAQDAYNASLAGSTGAFAKLRAGAAGATAAVGGLGTAMKGLGIFAVIGAAVSVLGAFAAANAKAKAEVDDLSASLDAQTGAFTDNTRAKVANMLEDKGALVAAQTLGLSLSTVTDALLGNVAAREKVAEAIKRVGDAEQAAATNPELYNKALVHQIDAAASLTRTMGTLSDRVENAQEKSERLRQATGDASNSLGDLDASSNAAQGTLEDLSTVMQDVIDTQYGIVGGTVDVQNSLASLGESLANNGTSFDEYSVAGRENLQALQAVMNAMATASGGDAEVLATNLAGLMQSLAQYGVNTVTQLGFVKQAIAQLATGAGGTSGLVGVADAAKIASNGLSQGFSTGTQKIKKTGEAAHKTAKEIKTLTDYVGDLSNVFKSSFDIRFGFQQAADKVAAGWQDMADSAESARQSILDATNAIIQSDATIAGLNAANNTLQYQLNIASQYDDMLRVTEITAELAKNNADLADEQSSRVKSQKDLTKAQQAAMPSLDGQTEGSREQRDAVLNLVTAYHDQVAALANQGLSQQEVIRRTAELKQQFINQLIQMGYNRTEVERYAASFDDLAAAIAAVPRNITVNADTSPAQRAIDEFIARNSNQNVNVGTSGGGGTFSPGRVEVGSGGLSTPNIRTNLMGANDFYAAKAAVGASGSAAKGLLFSATGGSVPEYHSAGGVHGIHPGGPRGTDTTPAWLTPGEFVMQKSAVSALGLPFMNALNNQQAPKYLASGGSAGGSASGPMVQIVEILPTQIQQIIDGVSHDLMLNGRVITESTNANNVASARRGSN